MILRSLLLLSLLALGACGDDGAGTRADASDAPVVDASGNAADADPGAIDAAAGDADASASAPDAAVANLGPVDCRSTADCEGIATCTMSVPGGHCSGCGGAQDCGAEFECSIQAQGTCLRDCVDDSDCNIGKRCLGDSCVPRPCNAGSPCPEPYVCSGAQGFCQRPDCDNGSCPAPLSCDTGSNTCVEP